MAVKVDEFNRNSEWKILANVWSKSVFFFFFFFFFFFTFPCCLLASDQECIQDRKSCIHSWPGTKRQQGKVKQKNSTLLFHIFVDIFSLWVSIELGHLYCNFKGILNHHMHSALLNIIWWRNKKKLWHLLITNKIQQKKPYKYLFMTYYLGLRGHP